MRTEFGGVFVQPDICNGCGYCVVSCPFGVIDRRPDDGRAFKCTFCYDRQKAGLKPACATACPTESIQFGDLDEMRARAEERAATLHARGMTDVTIYDPRHTSVGGTHAIFLFRGPVETFDLPADPVMPTALLGARMALRAVDVGDDAGDRHRGVVNGAVTTCLARWSGGSSEPPALSRSEDRLLHFEAYAALRRRRRRAASTAPVPTRIIEPGSGAVAFATVSNSTT